MKQILISFLAALLIGSCATILPTNQMTFMEAEVFDKQLSASMSADTDTITVAMAGEVSLNQMPERLGKWLSAVVDKQGRLDVEPRMKSFAWELWMEKVWEIVIDWLNEKRLYGPAGKYNVTVFHEPNTGKINKVVFSRKDE